MSHRIITVVLALAVCFPVVVAQAAGNMLSYFHFTSGDILWFEGWVPITPGAMVGTCIGMFILGLIERWMSVCAHIMGRYWDQQSQLQKSGAVAHSQKKDAMEYLRYTPPFVRAYDFPRGIIYAARGALHYVFMFVIMSFNLGFIFSLMFGMGVGEMLFGRFVAH